jgi:hypothetical protein
VKIIAFRGNREGDGRVKGLQGGLQIRFHSNNYRFISRMSKGATRAKA